MSLDEKNSDVPGLRGTSIATILIIAMLQGLLLWWRADSAALDAWPGSDPAASSALFAFAFFMAPILYLLLPWSRCARAWVLVLTIGLIVTLFAWHAGAHERAPGAMKVGLGEPSPMLFLVLLVLIVHALPFLQAYLQNGRWRPVYADLFRYSWDNAVRIALALLFTGIAWLLVWLCAELFDMLGLPFLKVILFEVPGYAWLILALAFGIGFFFVGSSDRLLIGLRQQLLMLLKWLTPVAATVLVAFAVALLIRTPWLISEHRHVISAKWLLSLVIVAVYLYNAAYQDGGTETPYPRRLAQILSKVVPLLALLSLMAAYDLWVRIHAYGLTSSRYWAVVVSIAAVTYSLGYSVAGFRSRQWMSGMGPTNVCVALVVIVMLAASLTPPFFPDRLAARSQARRLEQADGTAGPLDFMSLRFDAGGYGYDALASVASDTAAPAGIRKGAQAAVAVANWRERSSFSYTTVAPVVVNLEAFPANTQIDADLRAKISTHTPRDRQSIGIARVDYYSGGVQIQGERRSTEQSAKLGTREFPYPVLFIDLDGDGQPEAVAFFQNQAFVYQHQASGWEELGQSFWRFQNKRALSANDLRRALQSGDYRAVTPHWSQLQIGKLRLSVPDNDR